MVMGCSLVNGNRLGFFGRGAVRAGGGAASLVFNPGLDGIIGQVEAQDPCHEAPQEGHRVLREFLE
jgi:hypothetical protein